MLISGMRHAQGCHIKELVTHKKNQLNQAKWCSFEVCSENQYGVHNYLSIIFVIFPLLPCLENTSRLVSVGVVCSRHN